MISRLTASATVFAVLAAATIAFAANAQQQHVQGTKTIAAEATTEIVMLPQIVITGHRSR